MAYRVVVGGIPIECDSMEEAFALAQRAGGKLTENSTVPPPKPMPVPASGSRWTETRMKDFLGRLVRHQPRLIDELLDHPEGRTDEQLLKALGLTDGRQLAGVFTGLWKNAKKVGADPNDVYRGQRITIADRRMHEYTLSDSFRRIAMEVRPKMKTR